MNTNLLIALKNILNNPISDLKSFYISSNRANSIGEALELYIKDVFCNSVDIKERAEKDEIFSKYFSYIGNQNNPPDIIINKGDAIEVKKIENLNAAIALNSSYPKDKLYVNSPMITKACRDCENWTEKDILYAIGYTKDNILKSLWLVYGNCYAADKETYEKIRTKISSGLQELAEIEFSDTKELARVNRVDPLGITNLRVRGMWHIENPNKVFGYLTSPVDSGLSVNALLLKSKYESFSIEDRQALENSKEKGFLIKNIHIKSPNNPAEMLDAKLISIRKH